MRAVLLASLVASILATLLPAALQAPGGKVPKRPSLEAGADTNFAPACYLSHASSADIRVPDVKQRLAALGPVAGERP